MTAVLEHAQQPIRLSPITTNCGASTYDSLAFEYRFGFDSQALVTRNFSNLTASYRRDFSSEDSFLRLYLTPFHVSESRVLEANDRARLRAATAAYQTALGVIIETQPKTQSVAEVETSPQPALATWHDRVKPDFFTEPLYKLNGHMPRFLMPLAPQTLPWPTARAALLICCHGGAYCFGVVHAMVRERLLRRAWGEIGAGRRLQAGCWFA